MKPVSESSGKSINGSNFSLGKFVGKFMKKFLGKAASFFKRHRKKKIAAIVLLSVVLIIVYVRGSQEKVILASAGDVVKNSFEQAVFATGKLEVKGKQDFYAEGETAVKEIFVNAGEKVAKGQVVLQTDNDSLTIEAANNRVSYDDIKTKIVSSESNIRLYQEDYNEAKKKYDTTKTLEVFCQYC